MSTNPKAWLAVRDLGGGVTVKEIVTEGQEQAARDAGYTLTPLVPVSGEPVAWAVYWGLGEMRLGKVCLSERGAHEHAAEIKSATEVRPLFTHPPHALAASHAEVKRLRKALTIAEEQLRYVGFGTDDDAVHTAAEAARSALSTPADTSELDRLVADAGSAKWQPIETAPKDGTVFLGWVSAERWSSAYGECSTKSHDVSAVDFCWWRKPPSDMEDGGYFDNGAGQIGDMQEITHWMPLPDAPGAARAEVKS